MTSETTPTQESSNARWYFVHTYAGREESVLRNLEYRVKTMDMGAKIFEVLLPREEEIQYKEGERHKVMRKMYPGYLMVKMIMADDAWHVVRNTAGVTGFVSAEGGNQRRPTPVPLSQKEVDDIKARINAAEPRVQLGYQPGETVRIKEGPFADFMGTVAEVDEDRGKVHVQVSFFGRETPVELDFLQLEKG